MSLAVPGLVQGLAHIPLLLAPGPTCRTRPAQHPLVMAPLIAARLASYHSLNEWLFVSVLQAPSLLRS